MHGPSMFIQHTALALAVSIVAGYLNLSRATSPRTFVARVERVWQRRR